MYKSVPRVPDFPSMERQILDFWREARIFDKLRAQTAEGPRWSFLDGPITANNPMGVHHAWGRTLKDMYGRYHAMNGRQLRWQNGFDCQGLWVEVEVEKSLGIHNKREIQTFGIERFVDACKERVLTFAARQTEQSIRLGYWCEWDDPAVLLELRDALHDGDRVVTLEMPSGEVVTERASVIVRQLGSARFGGSYFTFSDENNYTIWTFLKRCFDEGHIYKGHDVMPWCGRCGTGLSQMEVAEGRRITKHTSVFARFPLREEPKTALLIWTTTPWTLPANVAVAVNPSATYLKVKHNDWIYYVAKGNFERNRVQDLQVEGKHEVHKLASVRTMLKGSGSVEVLGEIEGRELLGLTYVGPFDSLPAQTQAMGGAGTAAAEVHRVIAWDAITEDEGTGLVHIAPGCGAEDQVMGKENNLPTIAPLDENAHFVEGFGIFTGRGASEVADDVIASLRESGLLVGREPYPHVYPHCWRCKQELVFRPVDEWFIRMDWRDRIARSVETVQWIPPDGEAREIDWLRNMGDWMISKKRFWGLALPIWTCRDCGGFNVIGSREELKEKAVEGWEIFEGHSPHRPYIDAVKIRCERCGGLCTRIEDVGNPWLDAGIVPFSTVRFTTDPDFWSKWVPADLVLESFPGQFRNWFYSMLAMSAMLIDRAPFKTLLGYALVRDARGEEMHKSKGNSILFDEAAEVLGAEIMRYIYVGQKTSHNLNFPDLQTDGGKREAGVDAEARRRLLTFWNCYSFFVMYALADGWKPAASPERSENELDRWITSRLQRFLATAHQSFRTFEHSRLIDGFQLLMEELSNWYLRRSRRRFWQGDSDAYQTLWSVLTTTARAMAPALPFLMEEIYQNLVRSFDESAPESVHLTRYPEVDEAAIDSPLEANIETVIRIKNLSLNMRTQGKVKIRQPLEVLYVRPRDAAEATLLRGVQSVSQILEEANVKQLRLIEDERELVTISVKPNLKRVGPRAGKHIGELTRWLATKSPAEFGRAQVFSIEGQEIPISSEDIAVSYDGGPHLQATADHGTFVALDTTLTPELKKEGIAREFNRLGQEQRKVLGLHVSDRIHITFSASEEIAEAVAAKTDYLLNELLAERLDFSPALGNGVDLLLNGEQVLMSITRA